MVEVWRHGNRLFEVISSYSLPDDAWSYELIELADSIGSVAYLNIRIPDASPLDGPFVPVDAALADVHFGEGSVPWPILRRFIDHIERSGDIRSRAPGGSVPGE